MGGVEKIEKTDFIAKGAESAKKRLFKVKR